MEINKWKNILTDWIIHTGFLQPSFSVLEDSNLEAFFKAYANKIQHAKITEDNVYAFLKQRFPHFSFHHFDDDGLCSADFVFVYSLLLHFGCVLSRDVHIQNACKALGEFQQAAVANFFKQFGGMKYEAVTRGHLKKAIVDAIRTDVPVVEGMALSTPKKSLLGSPDTPKNRRLEQNMRELNKIRIQLETERYERGFIEIQVKEGQEQIERLQAQQRTHISELHELRNQLLYENDENRAPNVKDQDARSAELTALKRSITQLEDKVAHLLVETHCLETDKGTLTKKLKHSEEQIQMLFERSEEMTLLVDQLRFEVNEKTQTILDLTETNEQLQMMLHEYKSAGNPLDLNSTSDFSFSKHSEGGDSETSGLISLAKSVVDVQLKEKQLENEKLLEQMHQIEESKRAMEAEIEEFLSNNDYKLVEEEGDSTVGVEDRTEGLLDCLLKHFSVAITDMDQLKVRLDEQVVALSAQKDTLDQEITHLQTVIADRAQSIEAMAGQLERAQERIVDAERGHQAELEDLRGNCNALRSENDNLGVENRSYKATISTLEEDILIKVNELRELNMANERHKDKYSKLQYEHENSNRAVRELNGELEGQRKELENLSAEYEALRARHNELESGTEGREREFQEKVTLVEAELAAKRKQVDELESAVKQLQENNSIIEEVTTCLNEEIQGKNKVIAALEGSLAEEQRKVAAVKVKLVESERFVEERNGEIAELQGVIAESQERQQELEAEQERVEQQLQDREKKIAAAGEDKAALEDELTRLREQISAGDTKIEQLTQNIDAWQIQLEVKALKVEQLQGEKAEVEGVLTTTREQLNVIEEEKRLLSVQVTEMGQEIDSLASSLKTTVETKSAEIATLGEQITRLEHRNTELDEEVQESVILIAHLEEKVKFAEDEMEKMHRAETELQQAVAAKSETIDDLSKQLETAREERATLGDELTAHKATIVELEEEISVISTKLKDQLTENETLSGQVATMNDDILNKSMNISSLEAEVMSIKDTIEDLGRTITGLNEELQERDVLLVEREASAKEQLHTWESQLAAVESDKATLEQTLEAEKRALDGLQRRCNHLMELSQEDGQKINDLQLVRDELEERLRVAEETVASKELHVATVQDELKMSLVENSKLIKEVTERAEQLTLQQVELEDVKGMSEEMEKNIGELHEKLIEKQALIVGLETRVQEIGAEKDAVTVVMEEGRKVIEKQQVDVQNMQEMINTVNTHVDTFQREASASQQALKSELTEKIDQIGDLTETVASLTSDRNALQLTIDSLTVTVGESENRLVEITGHLEGVQSELAVSRAEKEALTVQMSDCLKTLEAAKAGHTKAVETLEGTVAEQSDAFEQQLSAINTHLQKALADREDLLVQRDDLRAQCVAAVARGEELRQKCEKAEARFDDLEAQVDTVQRRTMELTCALAEKEDFLNRNAELAQELEQRVNVQVEQNAVTLKALEEREAENKLLAEQLDEVSKEKRQLQSDLDVLKTVSNQKEFTLQAELDRLAEEKAAVGHSIVQLTEEAAVREQRIATLTEEVEGVKAQLASQSEAHESLLDEVEKKRAAVVALEGAQLSLEQERQTLDALIQKLTTENKVVELQLGECETKLAEINEECDAMKGRHAESLEQLQRELEEVRAERRTLLETNRLHERRLVELGAEVVEKERKVSLLMTDLHKNERGQMEESSKIHLLLDKIESYKTDEVKLQELENLHHREKEINAKLTTDVEILCAKLAKNRKETDELQKAWREERRELVGRVTGQADAEERMKDYRLEMEGKLEKMKDKMKTLYNEEMGKLKAKHERDLFEMRKEIGSKKQQLEEYETQCRKFSTQIRTLNERQLDMYKENEFMKTKLKMMEGPMSDLQRSSALSRSQRMLPPSSSMLSVANMKMEDEEGEMFNNTYLIDLKNGGPLASGRTSPSRESICLSELQHRNSMVPRHLRSTYSVQYGEGYREEDLLHGGGGIDLDDSMSSLLNTGQRKKVGGTTSYKRPGPPTPSKNGGRLSFGGTGGSVVGRLSLGGSGYDSLSQREALKEFNDNTGNRKSITRETPAKVLGSLFSNSSKVRNENATPKKRLSIFRNKK